MNPEDPIGIIELGNKSLKCVIFKVNNDTTEILSTSISASEGINNDVIVNITKASNCIRSCISNAEKEAKISLKKINIILEQPDFLCTKFSKHKNIDGSKIQKYDIEFLLKEAKKQLILNDKNQFIIHIFNHNYIVDGKSFVEEPVGVYANSLTHEITFITMPKNNLKNIQQVFINCDIEIERFFSRAFSLGVELFSDQELETGAGIIDLDFEKITLGLFKNLALVHSITFPFGINHLVKDVSKVCSLNSAEATNIIKTLDFSFENNDNLFDKDNYLKKKYFINSNFRKISKDLIFNVIKARLDEIVELIDKQLNVLKFSLSSGLSFILEGAGLTLLNIDKYFINFHNLNLKKLNKNNVNKKEDFYKNFISCFGAIKIIKDGWETEAIPEVVGKKTEKLGFLAKIFRSF